MRPYLFALVAAAAPVASHASPQDYTVFVQEAEQKTGLPTTVIRAVMSTESAGNARALSPKGAMGLMQIMPKTWDALRREFRLGNDPFDPRDNILAGAFYLRALYDAYGADGFLAAYNAGPGRWENHRDRGHPLPAETRAYVTAVSKKIGPAMLDLAPKPAEPRRPTWMEAVIFLPYDGPAREASPAFAPTTSPFVDLPNPPVSEGQ